MIKLRCGFIVGYGMTVHALISVLLLTAPASGEATASKYLVDIFGSRELAGIIGLLACVLTAAVFFGAPVLWLVPQMICLLLASCGSVTAVVNGTYGDGLMRPWQFILADQSYVILAAPWHFAALLYLLSGEGRGESWKA